MKKLLLSLFTIATLAAFLSTNGFAATKPKAKPTPPPNHTVIDTVSATSITVKTTKHSKTYKIIPSTTITYEGKTVTAADLKPGMKASVTAATDPDTAEIITATKAPKDPAPAAAKGKTKGK